MMRNSIFIILLLLAVSCTTVVKDAQLLEEYPPIYPDYIGVTVPVGIAPLDFDVKEETAQSVSVTVTAPDGMSVTVATRNGSVRFTERKWARLLNAAAGDTLKVNVSGRMDGKWKTYRPFDIYVSRDEIDYGLCYRLIAPGFESFGNIGIYQRELSSFKEKEIVGINTVNGCINCHSFRMGDPKYMNLHIRGAHGGTMILRGDDIEVFNTKTDSTISSCAYPYWHPSGDYIAYSTNMTRQSFYQGPRNILEVYDYESDVEIYDIKANRLVRVPQLNAERVWETFPAFSSDGRTLYFCAADGKLIPQMLEGLRYNIFSVPFDPETGEVGSRIDTLVIPEMFGKSASLPRPSPDGKFLVYTLINYGTFPIWHPEAELWMMNLETGRTRILSEINSLSADSYHSWSSNGRWMVFGSRRDDDVYTRAYICHVDENGICGKPFMLPQRSPGEFYLAQDRSYNIPEFITAPIDLNRRKMVGKIKSGERRSFQL